MAYFCKLLQNRSRRDNQNGEHLVKKLYSSWCWMSNKSQPERIVNTHKEEEKEKLAKQTY